MKKLGILFVILFVFLNSRGISQDYTDPKTFQTELENGVVSFVNTVKGVYDGSDLVTFKTKLIGAKNIKTITKEGDALLNEAYALIAKGANEAEIKKEGLKEFAAATSFVLDYIQKNQIAPDSKVSFVVLFGGDEAGLNESGLEVAGKPCKWWQIGCHLSNAWDWIVKNQNTLKTIAEIVKIFLK
jgi:hypothetical protein